MIIIFTWSHFIFLISVLGSNFFTLTRLVAKFVILGEKSHLYHGQFVLDRLGKYLHGKFKYSKTFMYIINF